MPKEICSNILCCGCRACENVCPRQCISMVKHDNGFYYPKINHELCTDCRRCQKVCPKNEVLYGAVNTPRLFAAYSLNEVHRNEGSSGGIFGELARYIISKDGVVYGAAFDEKLQLKHISVEKEHDLQPLFKSKYIESNTNGVFMDIKENLSRGRLVLFCGTPCQCAALRKIVNPNNTSNLFVVDFLCHGAPSQDLFNKSVSEYEKKHKGKILNFEFRSKPDIKNRNSDHYFSLKLLMKNGTIRELKNRPMWEFPYYSGFCMYNTLRPSCYDCDYANPRRVGDITIGDFWGLESLLNITDFVKGYSTVVVNTPKGYNLFQQIKGACFVKEFPISDLAQLNPTYTRGTIKTSINQQSLKDYSVLSYKEFENKYLLLKMDLLNRGVRFVKNKVWKNCLLKKFNQGNWN